MAVFKLLESSNWFHVKSEWHKCSFCVINSTFICKCQLGCPSLFSSLEHVRSVSEILGVRKIAIFATLEDVKFDFEDIWQFLRTEIYQNL